MDTEQAKLILSLYRPGRDDPSADPELAEALALAQRDPALGRWLAEEQAADEAMRQAMQSIQPPAGLRAAILAGAKTTPFPAPRPAHRLPIWLAAAAAVVVAGVLTLFLPRPAARVEFAALDADIPRLTAQHKHTFHAKREDLDQARAWIAAHGGIADFQMPPVMDKVTGMACEVAEVQRRKVTILCFELPNVGLSHLYVVDRAQFSNVPPDLQPQFQQNGGVAMASWSDGRYSYILAHEGEADSLRRIFSS